MSRITLLELLELPIEDIIAKANSQEREGVEAIEDDNVPIHLSDYRGLLTKDEVVVGKEFTLRNNYVVRILEINEYKNSVLICFDQFQYCKKRLSLLKLIGQGKDPFPYKIGERWYYKKTKKHPEEIIEIRFLNPSQKAVGYIKNGKRILIKTKKLIRREEENHGK